MAIETLSSVELEEFGPVISEQSNDQFMLLVVDEATGFKQPVTPYEVAAFALGDILSENEEELYDIVMPKLLPNTPEEANRSYDETEMATIQRALAQLVSSNQLSIECIRPLKETLGLPLEPEASDDQPALF